MCNWECFFLRKKEEKIVIQKHCCAQFYIVWTVVWRKSYEATSASAIYGALAKRHKRNTLSAACCETQCKKITGSSSFVIGCPAACVLEVPMCTCVCIFSWFAPQKKQCCKSFCWLFGFPEDQTSFPLWPISVKNCSTVCTISAESPASEDELLVCNTYIV